MLAFAIGVVIGRIWADPMPIAPTIIFHIRTIKEPSHAPQTTNDEKAARGKSSEPQEGTSQMETDVTSPTRCSTATSETPALEWTEDFFKLVEESTDQLGPLGTPLDPLSPLSGSDL